MNTNKDQPLVILERTLSPALFAEMTKKFPDVVRPEYNSRFKIGDGYHCIIYSFADWLTYYLGRNSQIGYNPKIESVISKGYGGMRIKLSNEETPKYYYDTASHMHNKIEGVVAYHNYQSLQICEFCSDSQVNQSGYCTSYWGPLPKRAMRSFNGVKNVKLSADWNRYPPITCKQCAETLKDYVKEEAEQNKGKKA